MNFESSLKLKLIYVFRINDAAHHGCLKVGEATADTDDIASVMQPSSKVLNESAKKRINQYTQTAGIAYDLLYTECTLYKRDGKIRSFNDKEVHSVLERSGVSKKTFDTENKANEWFETDVETVKRAIVAVKEGRQSLTSSEVTQEHNPIVFRPEQREAIEKTKKQFKRSQEMLWYAKMRFGKTLSALQVVKDMGFRRTLILTHRPVVDSGWYDDFKKIFYDTPAYHYGSKNVGDNYRTLEKHAQGGGRYVYFASMQDLRGSDAVGGKFNKNDDVFSTPWDLIIVDEAHEGTQTTLGKAVMTELTKPSTKILRLSGTPFNLLDEFKEDEIYTWDYVMEQRAKAEWDLTHPGDPNPYAGLPTMNIFTYNLGKLMHDFIDEDVAFNFREFFRVKEDGTFTHEKDVKAFLNLLTKEDPESYYPFANERYRSIFRHTLWMLPGVKAAKALKKLLNDHPVFQHFEVVNVAGDGDEERGDALEAVEKAIGSNPDETRTITLSCGRLTTGVSVKPWTGVFMLSGSFNTAASAYMQTIFRVQTPATINGRIKEQAYVFDFAPDRTLQVLATVPKMSAKAGKTTEGQKQAMGEFLNFCPVIAIEESKMETLNVNRMLEQLKKAYVERVVRNGFEDGALYNDELMKLSDADVQEFDALKGIIGQTKAIGNSGKIDINNQGLTNEEYEEKEKLEKKKKKELTAEEKRRLEELKKKKKLKEDAVSILRGISIRMPLMIYGADVKDEETELTIDNFTSLVDAQSWEEFMPKGVTKQHFNRFKKYYDPDIFSAAAKRIRAMARAADKLGTEERIERITSIFATFRNPDKETVLTPWRVVNMHIGDTLGGFNFFNEDYSETIEEPRFIDRGTVTADVFSSQSHVLEINSKSGLYPLYMAYSIYRSRAKESMFAVETLEQEHELWDKTIAENIFVVCKTPMAKAITRRTLLGFRSGKTNMWAPNDLINKVKNQPELFIKKVHDLVGKNVKINAIVGNPPYQEENSGDGNGANPMYHYFIDAVRSLSDISTLIHPARFLFNAGKTPKDWNKKILEATDFKVVDYWVKSTEVFPTVDVKGGIAVTLTDKSKDFGKTGIYSPYPEVRSILNKVRNTKSKSFAELVYPRDLYKLTNSLYEENPNLEGRQSSGHRLDMGSSIFEVFPELFLYEKPAEGDYIGIYGLLNRERVTRWIKRAYVRTPDNIDCYKVLVPKSNGTGAIGEVLSTPVIGVPVIGHTLTFLSVGGFLEAPHAEACLKYIKSRFARLLLGTLKVTQDNPRDTWANVPMQDFTAASDIDWSQSVADIDRQLYAKYNLNEEEINFIESMIKPM